MTLMATLRSSEISCARKTAAIPPRPSSRPISNSPRVARRSRSTMSAIGEGGSSGECRPSDGMAGSAGVPQCGQEGSPGRISRPHDVHATDSTPHCAQKRAPISSSPPQCRQMRVAVIVPPFRCGAGSTPQWCRPARKAQRDGSHRDWPLEIRLTPSVQTVPVGEFGSHVPGAFHVESSPPCPVRGNPLGPPACPSAPTRPTDSCA